MQIRSINYSLHFESVNTRKYCLYWKVFSTNPCRKIFFNSLLLFLVIFVGQQIVSVESVNSIISFWHPWERRQNLSLRTLILSFMKTSFPTSDTLFAFFYLVCKLFKGLFQPLFHSVNCMSSAFESYNISWGCPVT